MSGRALVPLVSAAGSSSVRPSSAGSGGSSDKCQEHKQREPTHTGASHLIQVEAEVTRIFDGLGSPVSSEADRTVAASLNASLMFGEILFSGVTRILDPSHLDGATVRTLYDLGSGCGRLCVQAFLQFNNIERVVGVELTAVRSKVGFAALLRMHKIPPKGYEQRTRLEIPPIARMGASEAPPPVYKLTVSEGGRRGTSGIRFPATSSLSSASSTSTSSSFTERVLELRQGNLFDCTEAWDADILICETNIAAPMQHAFLHFLSHCKPGCRLLTYNSLEDMYNDVCDSLAEHRISSHSSRGSANEHKSKSDQQLTEPSFPWKRMAINTFDDKFSTSWGSVRFHLYTRTADPVPSAARSPASRTTSGRRDSFASSSLASGQFSSSVSGASSGDGDSEDD